MKKILISLAAVSALFVGAAAYAEEAGKAGEASHEANPTHFPIHKPKEMNWTFAGPFGTYDKAQLQRGLKVYKEVCSACHSMKLVAFRTLSDLGYSEAQVKAFAAGYTVPDGPNEAAAASNGGAVPPDMSLLAKARGIERGFPQFVIDIFTQYATGGPDYIHGLITGYDQQPPAGMTVPEGTHYNPYFNAGVSLKMPKPISDGQVTYDDGAPQTVEQYSEDVSAFLMWAAEPHLEDRKKTGFRVMIFLLLFAVLMYLTKRKVWSNVAH